MLELINNFIQSDEFKHIYNDSFDFYDVIDQYIYPHTYMYIYRLFKLDVDHDRIFIFNNLIDILRYFFKKGSSALNQRLSYEQVILCYRLILNRLPKEFIHTCYVPFKTLYDYLLELINSEEFLSRSCRINLYNLLPDKEKNNFYKIHRIYYNFQCDNYISFEDHIDIGKHYLKYALYIPPNLYPEFDIEITGIDDNKKIENTVFAYDDKTNIFSVEFDVQKPGGYNLKLMNINSSNNVILCRAATIFALPENNNITNIDLNDIDIPYSACLKNDLDDVDFCNITIGTTSYCNASCIHCPVNKKYHANPPRHIMDLRLFESIMRQISLLRPDFSSLIMFGLFNEPLTDPFLLERISLIKEILPLAKVCINTNCALFKTKHIESISNADYIVAQFSGFSDDTYKNVMRLEKNNTYKNGLEILKFSKNFQVAVPISKYTVKEFNSISKFWLNAGASSVNPLALSNRCGELRNYDDLSIAPAPGRCRADINHSLFIDHDGKVLNCCQDFLRREIQGDLNKQTLLEILLSKKRKQFAIDLNASRWSIHNCRYCLYDDQEKINKIIQN